MSAVASRIRQARRRRGLSLRALAEKVGVVSHTTLAKYENGKSLPDSAVLIKIARALDYDLAFFLRPSVVGEIKPAYRKKQGLKKKEEDRIIEEIRDWLERYLTIEKVWGDRPPFQYPEGFPAEVASFEDVERAAVALREAWQVGMDPVEDLTSHLEDKGVRVGVLEADGDFDACAFEADVAGPVPVVVTNREGPGDRQRFNLAHELGHLMLRVKGGDGDGIPKPEPGKPRAAKPFTEERACHRFAGAFLAPEHTFRVDLGGQRKRLSPDELLLLKRKYGLSMAALVYRAHELGAISDGEKDRLYRLFDENGWKPVEPGPAVETEEPTRFRLLVLQALAEGLIGRKRADELYKEGPLTTPAKREVASG